MPSATKAVFLDRDGILNEMIWNPQTKAHESPHHPSDLQIIPSALEAVALLKEHGYALFVVSNQPSYAKGKTSLEAIKAIETRVNQELSSRGIDIREYYYCYHHPQGIVPEYTQDCPCRKPKAHFLFKAAGEYSINLSQSWMVGDRDTDVECGQNAGCRTVLVSYEHSSGHQGKSRPDFTAPTLLEAVQLILKAEAKT